MKTRDIIGIIIIIVVVIATGILYYTQIAPVPSGTGITVEVPPKVVVPLANEIDQTHRDNMRALQDYARPQEIRVCNSDSDKGCIGKGGIFQPS